MLATAEARIAGLSEAGAIAAMRGRWAQLVRRCQQALSIGFAGLVVWCVVGVDSARADFGFVAFDGAASDQLGRPFTQAGGHPFELAVTFELATITDTDGALIPDGGEIKDVRADAPVGFIGNPTAAQACPLEVFLRNDVITGFPCPESAQVGVVSVKFSGGTFFGIPVVDQFRDLPVYMLEPQPGMAALFAFQPANVPIFLEAHLTAEGGYHVKLVSPRTSQGVTVLGSTVTLWGVPAASPHDVLRGCQASSSPSVTGCSAEEQPKALLSNPAICLPEGEGFTTDITANSWTTPDVFAKASFVTHLPPGYTLDAPLDRAQWGPIQGTTGCDILPFKPSIDVAPESTACRCPVGIVRRSELRRRTVRDSGRACASAPLKRARVTLPEGMTVSPSSAPTGCRRCSDAQIGIGNDDPVGVSGRVEDRDRHRDDAVVGRSR